MPDKFTEIERKFLITKFPTSLPLLEEFQTYQAYLSIDPEVRIRRNVKDGKDVNWYLAVKSGGTLSRTEVEVDITPEEFYALARLIESPFILKDHKIYQLGDQLVLHASQVDNGSPHSFMYAEIEYPTVGEALESDGISWIPVPVKEVTNDPHYSMKNYWKRTRLEERKKIYIIGSTSQADTIMDVAKYYMSMYWYDVRYVQPEPDKPLGELIERCYKNIRWADYVYVIPKPDGSLGDGVQYEIAFAKLIGKQVEMLEPNGDKGSKEEK